MLCGLNGDGDTKGVARLLNLDVDVWIHLNCALWSAEVYETQVGVWGSIIVVTTVQF